MERMPHWADVVLVPLLNLLIAFVLSGLVMWAIGENPFQALGIMVSGALGSSYGWGYTLYYATNFMFTGLGFAVASHAGLFNIGGEGQATMGGLGVALMCLFIPWPTWWLAIIGASVGAAALGAAWAAIPAWLQAKRGSHIVITTIMFNFIAAAVLNYILVNVLRPAGSMDPSTANFPAATTLPTIDQMLGVIGIPFAKHTPANVTLLLAVAACVVVWLLIWHTRLGYEIRALGRSEPAAHYAGIRPVRITMYAMLISGALGGMMAVNSTMGESGRLIMNASEGAGFIGIAVALMGRNHPFGVFLAAMLFGFLYQGGGQLALMDNVPRELVIVIQALVILFTGALDNVVRMPLEKLFLRMNRRRT